jgi:hypothetical protein
LWLEEFSVATTGEGWACVGVDKVLLELIWLVLFNELVDVDVVIDG